MSLTDLLVPSFRQMLRNLSRWLEKGEAHAQTAGRDPDLLLSLKLAPDMYPLAAQVRFACFLSQEAIHRLRGQAVPAALLDVRQEGWAANDRPGTLADAQRRITEALAFLDGLAPDIVDAAAERAMALDLPNGMVFDLTGTQFARDWALPQVYFHLGMAYAILRHQGVDLGKADYVAHMLGYLRVPPQQG